MEFGLFGTPVLQSILDGSGCNWSKPPPPVIARPGQLAARTLTPNVKGSADAARALSFAP
jgi:hypothetical protein